jgi:hypothetical protein
VFAGPGVVIDIPNSADSMGWYGDGVHTRIAYGWTAVVCNRRANGGPPPVPLLTGDGRVVAVALRPGSGRRPASRPAHLAVRDDADQSAPVPAGAGTVPIALALPGQDG